MFSARVEIKDDNSIPFGSLGRKPGNNLNSATLRMVQELDSKGPEPEPGIIQIIKYKKLLTFNQ